MKLNTLTLLTALLTPMSAHLYAQTASGTSATIPTQGVNVDAGTTTSQGVTVGSGVTATQPQTGGMNSNDAQNAQANSVRANPSQTQQQATGGGVFGPSAGPGVFGPASQAVTTDIYGNQQPASGTVTQPSNSAQGVQTRGSQRPGQAQNPTVYDASGNPTPASGQSQLPRDLNPITPNTAQPSQTQPASSVTGR